MSKKRGKCPRQGTPVALAGSKCVLESASFCTLVLVFLLFGGKPFFSISLEVSGICMLKQSFPVLVGTSAGKEDLRLEPLFIYFF